MGEGNVSNDRNEGKEHRKNENIPIKRNAACNCGGAACAGLLLHP